MTLMTKRLRRQVRRFPIWVDLLAGGLAIAAGMFFVGRYTQNNSYRATYNREHQALLQRQKSLDRLDSRLTARRSTLGSEQQSLANATATLHQQQSALGAAEVTYRHQDAALAAAEVTYRKQLAALGAAEQTYRKQDAALGNAEVTYRKQNAALGAAEQKYHKQLAALGAAEQALRAEQTQVKAALTGLKAKQFGNGLFQVGRDILAGTYHTQGAAPGGTCTWALLHSDNPADVAGHNLSQGPQTVTITTPFFESSGCGTWTRVS